MNERRAERSLADVDVDAVLGSLRLEGLPVPAELEAGLARVVAGDMTMDELVAAAEMGVGQWKIRTATQAQAS